MTLKLYSEPFAATGSMAADGYRKLLGRPPMGLLQTTLRESLQNVLDATRDGSSPSVVIRLRTLSGVEVSALRNDVFADLPLTATELADVCNQSTVRVLEISDFGTIGLCGPSRADLEPRQGEPSNFVNFLRNVGATRDTYHGGGTYGFGKSALYSASSCATITVDSQTVDGGRSVRRLMACHLGAAFSESGKRYTGRHWWGAAGEGSYIEPLTGDAASELAIALGLQPRSETDTGTSVMILDPLLDTDSEMEVGAQIAETVLWNFWPRMTLTTPASRRLDVRLYVESEEIAIPRPEEFPPLDLFSQAMASLRAGGPSLQKISSGRPVKTLGALQIVRGIRADRHPISIRDSSVLPTQCAHVALMRPVELVVKYVRGEPFADPRFEWAGVFVCSDDDEVEQAFATAEPPAHDDWIPDNLPKGRAKTFVNVALREVERAARDYVSPGRAADVVGENGPSLAKTAATLGRFLNQVTATGPGRPVGNGAPIRSSRAKGVGVSSPVFSRLELLEGVPIAVFRAELRNDGAVAGLCVLAKAFLVADGSSIDTSDLPVELEPQVASILLTLSGREAQGGRINVDGEAGPIEIRVTVPARAAVSVRIDLVDAGAE